MEKQKNFVEIEILDKTDIELLEISKNNLLSLNIHEMQSIQNYYKKLELNDILDIVKNDSKQRYSIENDKIRDIIKRDFPRVKNPSRNDIIRYKLYQELAFNAYKNLYTDEKINYEKLYSKDYDIDHIIPQSKMFDDSFSNKVLVPRFANLEKGNQTAYDYMSNKSQEKFEKYKSVIDSSYKEK